MDTMRNLNKSLPKSSPKPRTVQPPEQLLQSFKTAALSVTNLYKTAALDQNRARQEGYQDALHEVLDFLDKENLGMGDGEGWQVRQWATERLIIPPAQAGSDSEDERVEPEKRAESLSPVRQRKVSPETVTIQPPSRSSSPVRIEPILPQPPSSTHRPTTIPARSESFTFRSAYPYPQDIDMQSHDTPTSALSQSETPLQPQATTTSPAVRVEVASRGSRTPHRHGNHSSKHNTRSTTSVRAFGSGTGSKRKIAFGDFFDISNLGDGKDGYGGGGKRGRLS